MEKPDVVERFYGVYLLKSLNPKYKGRTYIGYTVNPNRRITQHNRGKQYGGAWRTSQRGPWEMTLTVHGFPSDVAALRFEWAWQHPKRSRRLKNLISNKKVSESSFDYCLKIMFTMLKVPPWCRLPLTVRWLSADVMVDPPPNLTPPMHIPIVYGPVKSVKLRSPQKKTSANGEATKEPDMLYTCQLCHGTLNKDDCLVCLSDKCQGTCPFCDCAILWGDLVRKKQGCYNGSQNESETVLSDEDIQERVVALRNLIYLIC